MAPLPIVNFHYSQPAAQLRNRQALKRFIAHIFRREKRKLSQLTYVFCSDKELLKINKEFLHHDFFTDIITFDLSEGNGISGEVYISLQRVKENAATFEKSFANELHRVIFHGALHLCGYRDKTKQDVALMRQKEEEYLTAYFS